MRRRSVPPSPAEGKAFGRPHSIKQCAAPASLLPLLRGRWRGAPDEVVDVNDRPPHPSVLPLVELPPAAASASALGGKSQAVWLFLTPRAPEGRRLLVVRFRVMRRACLAPSPAEGKAFGRPHSFKRCRILFETAAKPNSQRKKTPFSSSSAAAVTEQIHAQDRRAQRAALHGGAA